MRIALAFLLLGAADVHAQTTAIEHVLLIDGIWQNGFCGQPYVGVDKLGWNGDSDQAVAPWICSTATGRG